jgi:exonuclease III
VESRVNTGSTARLDWSETALADSGLTGLQKSFRMSDHYPLWVEFEVP